jgi:hypothetical protein
MSFLGGYGQLVLLQPSKDFSDDFIVFLNCFGVDEEIVDLSK